MAKFVNSSDSISSSLLLWNDTPTQVSIQETYDLKVWPVTSIFNEGPINFNLPPQPKGLLTDVHVVTKLKLRQNGEDLTKRVKDVSVVNNLANSLWGEVSVICSDRTELCQSMQNAYAYQSFFNHALNSENDRDDYLFYNEGFLMDEGVTKHSEESLRQFWMWDDNRNITYFDDKTYTGDVTKAEGMAKDKENAFQLQNPPARDFNTVFRTVQSAASDLEDDALEIHLQNLKSQLLNWVPTHANQAASKRSNLINRGESLTLNSRLQCPLISTSKCLPTNMKIRIGLTRNTSEFLLLCNENSGYSLHIEDCYLNVTYYRVRDEILDLIEQRLQKDPIPYFISRPEIIVRPVTQAGRIIRMTDIFTDSIPPYAFFTLQKSRDFDGRMNTNPFIYVPFKKFQFYRNGVPYFTDALEVGSITEIEEGDYSYKDFGSYLRQLYRTLGKDVRGKCLIDSTNFHLNFMVGISFGADRSSINERHLNLQEKASTYLEIDMGITTVPEDLILVVYGVFDRQIQIDSDRLVRIIE